MFAETVWDDPNNESLRERRGDPHLLAVGDTLFVPAIEPKAIEGSTGFCHVFRRRGVPSRVRVRLEDDDDQPLADRRWSLEVDGRTVEGTTGADGLVQAWVSPRAKVATLTVWPELDHECTEIVMDLDIAALGAAEELRGAQARLSNLGFVCAEEAGVFGPLTQRAILAFQLEAGLDPTGELDLATQSALHGYAR